MRAGQWQSRLRRLLSHPPVSSLPLLDAVVICLSLLERPPPARPSTALLCFPQKRAIRRVQARPASPTGDEKRRQALLSLGPPISPPLIIPLPPPSLLAPGPREPRVVKERKKASLRIRPEHPTHARAHTPHKRSDAVQVTPAERRGEGAERALRRRAAVVDRLRHGRAAAGPPAPAVVALAPDLARGHPVAADVHIRDDDHPAAVGAPRVAAVRLVRDALLVRSELVFSPPTGFSSPLHPPPC